MSPLDVPLGLSLVGIGAGSFVVFLAVAGIGALVERIRRDK